MMPEKLNNRDHIKINVFGREREVEVKPAL